MAQTTLLRSGELAAFHSSLASFLALLQPSLLSFDMISGCLRLDHRLVGVTDCFLGTSKKRVTYSQLSTLFINKTRFE